MTAASLTQTLFVLVAVLATLAQAKLAKLGSYSISDVTVSGLSSGGFFAVQMHVAFSSVINGSAVFAGGPYYCAEANLIYAEDNCMQIYMGGPNINQLVSYTTSQATMGAIDNPAHMADDRIYLFSGKDDTVVNPQVMLDLQTYYQVYVDVSNIVADYSVAAEHCLPTLSYGEPCATLASPYIGKCAFDGAYMAFNTLYGTLSSGSAVAANLIAFDQTPYIEGTQTSIGDEGYIYVPTACANGATCRLHVSFHGCKQNLDKIGNEYAADTGFNSWAEANNIIVLYPYVVSSQYSPSNPNGCWDWWAYSGKDYALKSGKQMTFVKNLIDQVSGGASKTKQ